MHSARPEDNARDSATNKENLTVAQLKALGPLASGEAISHVAEAAGVDRSTVYRWLKNDAEFVAEFNRRREESVGAIQSELRTLAREAVAVLREILLDKNAPSSVRLRAALALLRSVGGIQAPDIGETEANEIQQTWTLLREQKMREIHRAVDY